MKRISVFALSLLFIFSCKEEEKLTFTEINILLDENAIIEINIPKANEKNTVGKSINNVIDDHIANTLSFSEEGSNTLTLQNAIQKFKADYIDFKTDFNESALIWEATFDGELIYESEELITIALSSYTNTGGAHGNATITLLNFNPLTGQLYTLNDIVSDEAGLKSIVKTYFAKELQLEKDVNFEDFFFGKDFSLPSNIGFNDDGLLVLYNVYEIASYDQGITEFTIPIEDIKSFLKIY